MNPLKATLAQTNQTLCRQPEFLFPTAGNNKQNHKAMKSALLFPQATVHISGVTLSAKIQKLKKLTSLYFIQSAQQLIDQSRCTVKAKVATVQQNQNYMFMSTAKLLISIVLLLVVQGMAWGQSQTFTTAGSGSYQIPAGVRKVTVETWGAGGGGGADNEWYGTGAGGGGGGAYAKINSYTVTPLNSYPYTVGAPGAGGTGTNNGGNGGNSSFNTTVCVAQGGRGGEALNDGTGGAGGTTASSTGDLKYAGGAGSAGIGGGSPRGGGGGGSAGTGSNGNTATTGTGASAVTGGGPGGNGGNNSNGSAPASGPGGGGGGAENNGTSGTNGGAGYAGQVKISWACPSISLTSGSSTPTVCVNTPITNIVYTIGDNYVAANVTGLPNGVTHSIVGNTLTISGTPTTSGAYTITLTKPTGCASDATANGTISLNERPTATIADIDEGTTNVSCYGGTDGTVKVTASGGSGTGYEFWIEGTGLPGAWTTGASNPHTFTGLSANILYTVKVKDSNGCISLP